MSRPWREKRSSFDNLFPSASLKYELPFDIDASLGFSTTIRRAPYSALSGVFLVNDANQTVRVTNADLQPESAHNYALRFARYSKSLGMFSVSFFENQIEDMFLTTTLTSQEYGNTDPTLDNYLFTTTINSEESTTMRGLELQFSQNLGFLSKKYFKRLNVNASYTRNYVRKRTVTGLVPEIINAGFDYTYGRFNVYVNGSRAEDRYNTIGVANRIDKGRTYVSAGGNIRLTKNLRLGLSIRNLTDSPEFFRVEKRGDLPEVMQLYQSNGTTYTFQLKANF
jgi:iron complex outermembrane recepter protein